MKTTQDIQELEATGARAFTDEEAALFNDLPDYPDHEYEPPPEEPEPRDYDEDQPDAMTPDEWEEMMDQDVCIGFDASGLRIFG